MKPITEHRKFESIEDYLAFEEKSEVRHEYYFENLIEMAGSTKLHNQIVFFLLCYLDKGWQIKNLIFHRNRSKHLLEVKIYFSTRM